METGRPKRKKSSKISLLHRSLNQANKRADTLAVANAELRQLVRLRLRPMRLMGSGWFIELIAGDDAYRFYKRFGLSKDTFIELVRDLEGLNLIRNLPNITVEEQVGIFLFAVTTNLPIAKIAASFQRDEEAIQVFVHIFFIKARQFILNGAIVRLISS